MGEGSWSNNNFLSPQCAARSVGPANNLLTTFVSTIIALHCNISTPDMWPEDYGYKALQNGLEDYDYVVIGAGSAGSVVAGRLAENINDKVLLIEAGGDPPIEAEIPGLYWLTLGTEVDWRYPTHGDDRSCLGQQGGMCVWPKGKAIGGSHIFDGMIYFRGNSRDYDEWESHGNPTWGWNDVQYYFKKTENFTGDNKFGAHGTSGPMNVEPQDGPRIDQYVIQQAANELGYERVEDFIAGFNLGFGRYYGTKQNGRRMTTAKAFLTKPRPNLDVIKYSVAKKIHFDEEWRADRVSFTYREQYDLEVRAHKEIIVSAGAIESPKLLMLSGVGPAPHLNSLGIPVVSNIPVGNNLQDHVRVEFFLKFSYQNQFGLDSEFLNSFYSEWVHRSGSFATPSLDISGFIDTDNNGFYPDIQLLFAPVPNIFEVEATYKDEIITSFINQVKPADRVISVWILLLNPKSRGTVRLQSKDYRDKPIIRPNYFDDDDDMNIMLKAVKRLTEFERTETFRSVNGRFMKPDLPDCDLYEDESEEYWLCYIRHMSGHGLHAAGTVKMGPIGDITSAVDSELRVKGVHGLRVVDASIMPNIISGTTNAATIMIAEKATEFIKHSWDEDSSSQLRDDISIPLDDGVSAPEGEGEFAGGDHENAGGEDVYAGGENADGGAEDVGVAVEDFDGGGDHENAVGEDAYAGTEDAYAGGDVYAGGEDVYAGGEDVHAEGEDVYAGGEDVYAGGEALYAGENDVNAGVDDDSSSSEE